MAKTDRVLIGAVLAFLLAGGLCVCCLGGVAFLPFRWFGSTSGPFGAAKEYIRKDPAVAQRLGKKLEFGMVPSGSVSENNGEGKADLRFDVKGSKDKGAARVVLEKRKGGDWEVVAATLEVGSTTVPLKGKADVPAPGPESPPPETGPSTPEAAPPRSGESVNA